MITKVRLVKLRAAPDAHYPPASKAEHVPGDVGVPGKSLPIDYELVGFLHDVIITGKPMTVARTHRNGVAVDGIFTSSPVKSVRHIDCAVLEVCTLNSVYRMERLAA